MQVQNNMEEAPLAHYKKAFSLLDPARRAKELSLPYENGRFTLTFLGRACTITWPDGEIEFADPSFFAAGSAKASIFLLRYLLEGKNLPSSGNALAFADLPWGRVYLQPFTGRCLSRTAWKYNGDPGGFCAAAKALGGTALQHADSCFRFDLIGEYYLIYYLWAGDEEFPPNAQIEFSSNFAAGFSAEDSVVAAELIITGISALMKKQG